jgi:hypothetical protein
MRFTRRGADGGGELVGVGRLEADRLGGREQRLGGRAADVGDEPADVLPVEPSAVYAAQAATVLLDAIARSDGTRRSVIDELLRTRVSDGLLGAFRFDPRGDISESPVTVLRVRRAGTSRTIMSVEGAVVERVMRPSPALVAAGG